MLGIHIFIAIAEHACYDSSKTVLKRIDCKYSCDYYNNVAIYLNTLSQTCACDPYNLNGDQAKGKFLPFP